MDIFQFQQFLLEKQAEWGRVITIQEISDGTGLTRETVSRAINKKQSRLDVDTIIALCRFFKLPAGPVPFIIFDPDGDDKGDETDETG